VHFFEPANNRIDWTGGDAEGAADALARVDEGEQGRTSLATFWIKGQFGLASEGRQGSNAVRATRGAAVDGGSLENNGLRIGPAGLVAAARALGLRQDRINGLDGGLG
jgi:hypothetical protein